MDLFPRRVRRWTGWEGGVAVEGSNAARNVLSPRPWSYLDTEVHISSGLRRNLQSPHGEAQSSRTVGSAGF